MKKNNNIIIGVLIAVIAVMGVAFAAFATTLNINGSASISSNWIITFVPGTCTATSKDSGNPSSGTVSVSGTTATVVANMSSPGDVLACTVKAQNQGTLDADRTSWSLVGQVTDTTAYTVSLSPTTNPGSVLAAKSGSTVDEETLTITITYKSTVTAKPSGAATFKAVATYEQDI